MLGHGMVDELDDLIVANPAMRMKHQTINALLGDCAIESGLHVGDSLRIVWLLQMLRLPIAWGHTRKLPAQSADDIGVGVVFDRVDKRAVPRQILDEALPPLIV